MMKSRILEFVLATVVCLFLLAISIPRFLENQRSQQPQQLTLSMDQLFTRVTQNPTRVLEFAKQNKRRVEFSQMNITSPDQACFWKIYTLDLERIQKNYPTIDFPDWRLGELRLSAVTLHGFNQNEVLNDQTGQYTTPYYFGLKAEFGKTLSDELRYPITIRVDAAGAYGIHSESTDYDVSNGLFSRGEILFESRQLRMKQQATGYKAQTVVMHERK